MLIYHIFAIVKRPASGPFDIPKYQQLNFYVQAAGLHEAARVVFAGPDLLYEEAEVFGCELTRRLYLTPYSKLVGNIPIDNFDAWRVNNEITKVYTKLNKGDYS